MNARIVTILVLLSLSSLSVGCANIGGTAADLGAAALDCAKQSMKSKVGAVVGEVLKLSRTGGEGWEASLLGLGISYGEDVLRCALAAAETELGGTRAIGDAPALERLKGLRSKKGW